MTKIKFLLSLRDKLASLPEAEIEERLNFYSEMIEDRMEEGLSEDEAVAAVGSIDDIAVQILSEACVKDSPADKEKKTTKKKLEPWVIVLLILGAPLWLSLFIGAFSIAISLYASLWAVVGSLWGVFAALIGTGFGGVVLGGALALIEPLAGIALISASMVCAGLSIFAFLGCSAATRGAAKLTKLTVSGIKRLFSKKEAR